ncbi:MAG: cytidine deaminase [Defluviitaleaceae bacterium]|nr:cytidine deaminase [Defluviitaleaceae bacterium]
MNALLETFDITTLIAAALKVRESAYSPYSGFKVGAALMSRNRRIFTGCNIESAAFSPTICAERTAFANAISEGYTDFIAIVIIGGLEDVDIISEFCYPCGVCRQFMAEFCNSDFYVIVAIDMENWRQHTLGELLPNAFGKKDLSN